MLDYSPQGFKEVPEIMSVTLREGVMGAQAASPGQPVGYRVPRTSG